METIIYGSKYRTAKQSAEELSKRINIKAENYKNMRGGINYSKLNFTYKNVYFL